MLQGYEREELFEEKRSVATALGAVQALNLDGGLSAGVVWSTGEEPPVASNEQCCGELINNIVVYL